MRIAIDISAANDPDAHQWLDRILHRIEDGWHVWDLTDTLNADAIETTTWIQRPRQAGQSTARAARRIDSARRLDIGSAQTVRARDCASDGAG